MTNVFLETDTRGFMGRYSRPGKTVWLRSPQTLVEAVEMAVDQVDTNCLGAVASAQAGTAFQPRTLLGLLTFCYARQIYSSSEITDRVRLELQAFGVSGAAVPDAPMLHRFRAENRGALSFCLKLALLFLAEEKIRQGVVTHVKRAYLAREANRRIIMALFTDSLEAPAAGGTGERAGPGLGLAVRRPRVH